MNQEKDLKKIICKSIAEATGTPVDFQEGHCGGIGCSACIYSKLPTDIINAGYGDTKQAVREFAKEVFEGLSEFLAEKHITSANEVKQIIRRIEERYEGV